MRVDFHQLQLGAAQREGEMFSTGTEDHGPGVALYWKDQLIVPAGFLIAALRYCSDVHVVSMQSVQRRVEVEAFYVSV